VLCNVAFHVSAKIETLRARVAAKDSNGSPFLHEARPLPARLPSASRYCLSIEVWRNCANSSSAACVWQNALVTPCDYDASAAANHYSRQQLWQLDRTTHALHWWGNHAENICLEACDSTALSSGACSLVAGGRRNVGACAKRPPACSGLFSFVGVRARVSECDCVAPLSVPSEGRRPSVPARASAPLGWTFEGRVACRASWVPRRLGRGLAGGGEGAQRHLSASACAMQCGRIARAWKTSAGSQTTA
jgi:hypothetical protein